MQLVQWKKITKGQMECAFFSSVCYNKISQTRWLKPQTFISHNLEVGNSKIKTLTSLMSDESDLLGLQIAAFYTVPESHFVSSLLLRTLIISCGLYPVILSNPNFLPKASSLNTIMLGWRTSKYEFWKDTFSPQLHDCVSPKI